MPISSAQSGLVARQANWWTTSSMGHWVCWCLWGKGQVKEMRFEMFLKFRVDVDEQTDSGRLFQSEGAWTRMKLLRLSWSFDPGLYVVRHVAAVTTPILFCNTSVLSDSVFLLFPGYPGSYFAFSVLDFRIYQVGIKFLHSMFLFLDTCLWFSEKLFQKMISQEGWNHFRHQLTYLPLKQESHPCSCYLNPSQGSQLHLFSFIYCIYP